MKPILLLILMLAFEICAAQPATGPAAGAQSMESMAVSSILQMTFGLILVVLLIFGFAWFMKRFGRLQGGLSDQLKVVGSLAMGARERIVLIQVGPRQILVGVTPNAIQTLHVLEEPIVSAQHPPAGQLSARFSEILKKQFGQ
ncbi:MAG: flagellar biosynthetic protein FliO [Pseudomonadota bacterium]